MGCNCGGSGGGSALANYEVKDKNGKTVRTFSAVREVEVTAFAAKNSGYTWRKTS
jgi:hypothetical protein